MKCVNANHVFFSLLKINVKLDIDYNLPCVVCECVKRVRGVFLSTWSVERIHLRASCVRPFLLLPYGHCVVFVVDSLNDRV